MNGGNKVLLFIDYRSGQAQPQQPLHEIDLAGCVPLSVCTPSSTSYSMYGLVALSRESE